MNRVNPKLPPQVAFDATEIRLITLYGKTEKPPQSLGDCIRRVAKTGDCLASKLDPSPGNSVIWRWLNNLHELRAGYELPLDVGN